MSKRSYVRVWWPSTQSHAFGGRSALHLCLTRQSGTVLTTRSMITMCGRQLPMNAKFTRSHIEDIQYCSNCQQAKAHRENSITVAPKAGAWNPEESEIQAAIREYIAKGGAITTYKPTGNDRGAPVGMRYQGGTIEAGFHSWGE